MIISCRTCLHSDVELGPLGDQRLELSGDVVQRLGQDGVDGDHRAGDRLERPGARNSKRFPVKANGLVRFRSPGSVGSTGRVSTPIVSVPFSLELVAPPLAIWSKTSVSWSPRKIEMIAGGASLAPSRWSLVADATDARKQAAELMDGADHRAAEHEELGIVVRRVPGEQKVALGGIPEGEVHVLPRAVDAVERLLVEQALHPVLLGDPLEGHHQQLLVVGGDVRPLEHRGQLELTRRDLVVASLRRDTQLEQLPLGVEHEPKHPLGNRPEVVVVELLALGGFAPNKVRPELSRSGRERKKLRSIRKYSCSAPANDTTASGLS